MLGTQKRLSRLERRNPIRRSNRKKPSPETIKIIVLAAKEKIRREWGEPICGGAKRKENCEKTLKKNKIKSYCLSRQIHVGVLPATKFI